MPEDLQTSRTGQKLDGTGVAERRATSDPDIDWGAEPMA